MKDRLPDGHDLIFQLFPETGKTSLSDRTMQLESLFIKAGLLK